MTLAILLHSTRESNVIIITWSLSIGLAIYGITSSWIIIWDTSILPDIKEKCYISHLFSVLYSVFKVHYLFKSSAIRTDGFIIQSA